MKQFIISLLISSPSIIKVFYFQKMRGYHIGKNVVFNKKSWIYGSTVTIEDYVILGKESIINGQNIFIGKNTVISDNVKIIAAKSIQIGESCFFDNKVVFGGGQSRHSELIIGNRVKIFEQSFINTTRKVIIEDEVGIGGRTLIFTHGTWQNTYKGYPYKFGDVTIKKNAWLPWQVFVMPGITIGENSTIGSASVVVKDVPDNCFAVGFPAKVIKQKEAYVKIGERYKTSLLKEIFEEICLDYNFLHKQKYLFDKQSLSISGNGKILIQFIDDVNVVDSKIETLFIYDKKEKINLTNFVNLYNNYAVIKYRNHFISFFITAISNYGIRIIEH